MTEPRGLTRRRLLRRAGVAGLAVALGGAQALEAAAEADGGVLPLTPEQEEGPFYVALEQIRRDIRAGRPGVPLHLRIKVVTTSARPIRSAACDIWQCDASGVYSDESSEGTVGQTWLRGVQLTDAKGVAEFVTIYPGHYQGRTTHIHVKVHIGGTHGHVAHTGQLLFDDAITTKVYALAPYASETAARVYNAQDHVYTAEHGAKSMLRLATPADGYAGAITLVVNPAATP